MAFVLSARDHQLVAWTWIHYYGYASVIFGRRSKYDKSANRRNKYDKYLAISGGIVRYGRFGK